MVLRTVEAKSIVSFVKDKDRTTVEKSHSLRECKRIGKIKNQSKIKRELPKGLMELRLAKSTSNLDWTIKSFKRLIL